MQCFHTMKIRKKFVPGALIIASLCSVPSLPATPTTQITNPSVDIQALRVFNLNISNGFSITDNGRKPYASGTDIGLTYGAFQGFEAGVDLVEPSAHPLYFNAKYGIPEGKIMPAIAVGGFNFGLKAKETNYNIFYGMLSKTLTPLGRFTLGCYQGNGTLLIDESGKKANTGMIVTWDKTLNDKLSAMVDYASGKSFYGALSFGVTYVFAPNTSINFAFVRYNNHAVNLNNQFTTQLSINL